MRILVTHPGRHGDILWALPTVRAISRWASAKVDFMTSKKYGRICDLLNAGAGDYIGYAWGDPAWEIEEGAPITPRVPPLPIKYLAPGVGPVPGHEVELRYDRIIHLGYPGWPSFPLAQETLLTAEQQMGNQVAAYFDLDAPWLKVKAAKPEGTSVIALGWSEEWIELKMGITSALAQRFAEADQKRALGVPSTSFHLVYYPGGRHGEWIKSFPNNVGYHATDSWLLRAQILQESEIFLGCLSGSWVLANALGMPTVICEPEEMRWNPIFWRDAPRNTLVKGNDGRPTFDSRHVGDALEAALRRKG